MYIYIYIYMYTSLPLHIYIYICCDLALFSLRNMANLRTMILEFGGFTGEGLALAYVQFS